MKDSSDSQYKIGLQIDQNLKNYNTSNETNREQVMNSGLQNQLTLADYLSSTFRFKQQNRLSSRIKTKNKKNKEKIEDDNDVSYLKSQLQHEYQDQFKSS